MPHRPQGTDPARRGPSDTTPQSEDYRPERGLAGLLSAMRAGRFTTPELSGSAPAAAPRRKQTGCRLTGLAGLFPDHPASLARQGEKHEKDG